MSSAAPADAEDLPIFEKPSGGDLALKARSLVPIAAQPQFENVQHKLNSWLSVVLLAVLALAAVPLGSNRPAFWAIWGVVTGLVGFVYAVLLVFLHGGLRVRVRHIGPEALLFGMLCAYLVFQLLPLGRWLPQSIGLEDGTTIALNSFSLDPGSTWLVLMQFATFALIFFLAMQVAANRRRARRMLLAMLGIVTAGAVYGLVSQTQLGDTILGFEKEHYQGYVTGSFVNRNSFATFLAMGLAIGVPLLLDSLFDRSGPRTLQYRLGRSLVILLCIAVIGAALFATGSRMGNVAGLAGVVVALALSVAAMRTTLRAGLALALGGAAIAVLLFALFGSDLVERLVFIPGIDTGRAELHRQVWAAIWERPWFGYGAGSFASVFPVFQDPSPTGNLMWDHTHSTYIALWFELGLIAGSIPLVIVGLLLARAFCAVRDLSSTTVSVAAVAAATVVAVHSLMDFSAEIEANAFLFTLILALGAAGAVGTRANSGS